MKFLYALAALIVAAGIVLLFVPDQNTHGSVLLAIGAGMGLISSVSLRKRGAASRS